MDQRNCNLHPSFQSKSVYVLQCQLCESTVCVRGMKAMLLADRNMELYSTDLPPPRSVDLVGKHYTTSNCQCQIKDVACSRCGNIVGYHVTLACHSCLASCNNGHFWMFHANQVHSEERLNMAGNEILVWAELDHVSEDRAVHPPPSDQPLRWMHCLR